MRHSLPPGRDTTTGSVTLRPFQRKFVRHALTPGIDTAALSLPRGNGKSWLAAHLLTRALTPGDPLHVSGAEYLLGSGSIEQARLVYRFVRGDLEPRGGYRFLDAATRIGITHKASNPRLRILSSNGKTAMGIVGCPLRSALRTDPCQLYTVTAGGVENVQRARGESLNGRLTGALVVVRLNQSVRLGAGESDCPRHKGALRSWGSLRRREHTLDRGICDLLRVDLRFLLLRRPAAAVSPETVQGSCAYRYDARPDRVRIRA